MTPGLVGLETLHAEFFGLCEINIESISKNLGSFAEGTDPLRPVNGDASGVIIPLGRFPAVREAL